MAQSYKTFMFLFKHLQLIRVRQLYKSLKAALDWAQNLSVDDKFVIYIEDLQT